MLSFTDVGSFEERLGVTIAVLCHKKGHWRFFTTGGARHPKTVFVLLHDKHYYGILNIKAFIGASYLCNYCYATYSHKHQHACKGHCHTCDDAECCEVDAERKHCPSCKLFCRSEACLDRHRALAAAGKVDCNTRSLCDKCGFYAAKNHRCKSKKCPQCYQKTEAEGGHECYMRNISSPEEGKDYVFYDFECMQETGVHVPNYVYALHLNKKDSWEFKGIDCVSEFVRTFIDKRFKNYTFIAHNAKGYDGYFILRQLIKEKMPVSPVTQGGKLMCVTVTNLNIRFIDSLNFLPMKLSKLPKAMGFQGVKGYFPHFFNKVENQNYVGHMPDVEAFGVEYMMPEEQKDFLNWHQHRRQNTFDLQKELRYYCQKDVEILRKACDRFRKEVMRMTKKQIVKNPGRDNEEVVTKCIDPFQYLTLASICMAMYRFNFLQPRTIALLPLDNYHNQQKRYSTLAIQWLLYVSHTENLYIQHALQDRELKVGSYFLDGYAEVEGKPTAIEFNGCFFHGCPVCYCENDFSHLLEATYGQLYNRTIIKTEFLKKQGFEVRTLWEHEWQAMLANDNRVGAFL
ncbi:uncharacterized protein LOC106731428 [Pelodiscus sinensis]|uniref:uncharacterized protein LOC106731428 n=1 Tax=Pelodiscus sinensis TaxID=13735 RepID=UPI003F6D7EBB